MGVVIFHRRNFPWRNSKQEKPSIKILGGENFQEKFYMQGRILA